MVFSHFWQILKSNNAPKRLSHAPKNLKRTKNRAHRLRGSRKGSECTCLTVWCVLKRKTSFLLSFRFILFIKPRFAGKFAIEIQNLNLGLRMKTRLETKLKTRNSLTDSRIVLGKLWMMRPTHDTPGKKFVRNCKWTAPDHPSHSSILFIF